MSEGSAADNGQLTVLSVLWYVWGALYMIGGCGGGVFALLGGSVGAIDPADEQLQESAAVALGVIGCAAITVLVWGALTIFVGRSLATTRNRLLITIMSVINLLSFPLGTALGVFTLVVLSRPPVAALFEEAR